MEAPEQQVLAAVARALRARADTPRVSVAFSGGMDSTVLLEAVCRLAPALGHAPPRALHVDHGLSPEAGAWCAHATRWCRARGVALQRLAVRVPRGSARGLEDAARTARYAALAAALETGEVLCVAHHADDQAETVLLNLLRGAGSQGHGAMRAQRALGPGTILRPLLGTPRAVLAECARRWRLTWVCDPANQSLQHPRNRLRHQVLPALRMINPAVVEALCRSAALSRESAAIVDALAVEDLRGCAGDGAGALSRNALCALPAARRRAVLRAWCREREVPVPGHAHLLEMDRQIAGAGRDRAPSFRLGAARLTVHGDAVWLWSRPPLPPPRGRRLCWTPGAALAVPGGVVWADRATGAGLRAGDALEIRFRTGGERCRPCGRRHSQTLKKLFQEYRVPPWSRERRPLLYRDGCLVGVAGLFVCHGHEALPGESGWLVRWRPAVR